MKLTLAMTEAPRRSWFTTRRVILIAGLLIGFAEIAGLLSIIFWASGGFLILTAWYGIGILFFAVMMLYSLAEPYGYSNSLNLVDRTPNPQRTWLYVHFGYFLIGLANVMIVVFAFLSSIVTREPISRSFEAWMFFTSATVFVVDFLSFFLLKLIGQEYEGLRGVSYLGSSALATVAKRALSGSKREGIGYLLGSLGMLKALSQSWPFYAIDLDRVIFTVRRLSQVDDPPFDKLETLSAPLIKLPDLEGLPDAFRVFLEAQKWSSGFEPHRIRRSSVGARYLLTFLLGIFGIVVALYPSEVRDTLASLGSSIANDPLGLMAFLFSMIAIASGSVMATYRVALYDIRDFSDGPLVLSIIAAGIFWILWNVAGVFLNPPLAAVSWYWPGTLLIVQVGRLVWRRLQRKHSTKK